MIVNAAEQPNWKNGLLAALLAEFTAFPLTVILSIGVPTFFSTVFTHPEHLQQALPMLLFLSVMSFTALHYVGWYTTLCALIFGPLLGGLQGYFEWKAFLDRFERS